MQLIKFSIVLVLLTTRSCRANIVLGTSKEEKSTSKLIEDVINIVTTCYDYRTEGIVLAGDFPDTLPRTLSVQRSIPVALIGIVNRIGGKLPKALLTEFRHKLPIFIVEASSFTELDNLIAVNVRFTMWWNHMALFLILDVSPTCYFADDYLFLAWQRNILNAKVLCNRNESRSLMFSFNPFTGQAPISWKRFNVFPGLNKHPFTVFRRKYGSNKTTCVDLDFEKTANLGGHVITAEGGKLVISKTLQRGNYQFWTKINRILHTYLNALNATIKISDTDSVPVLNGNDISGRTSWMPFSWSTFSFSYPHEQLEYVIVTRFRGYKTEFDKILSIIDRISLLGMGIVFLITLVFFKFFVGQSLVPAILNLIRIISNTGATNLPGNNASRIYLGCLLFFVVTMRGVYQGGLTSLQTTVITLPNINTIQDFMDLEYKHVCYQEEGIMLIDNPVIRNEGITVNSITQCFSKLRDDPSIGIFGSAEGTLFDLTVQLNLHPSSEPTPVYAGFVIRWDWPLEESFNIIIQRLVEADALEQWESKCNPIKFSDSQYGRSVKNNRNFTKVGIGDLAFAFAILYVGLACATVTFITEFTLQFVYTCKCRIVQIAPPIEFSIRYTWTVVKKVPLIVPATPLPVVSESTTRSIESHDVDDASPGMDNARRRAVTIEGRAGSRTRCTILQPLYHRESSEDQRGPSSYSPPYPDRPSHLDQNEGEHHRPVCQRNGSTNETMANVRASHCENIEQRLRRRDNRVAACSEQCSSPSHASQPIDVTGGEEIEVHDPCSHFGAIVSIESL